MTFVDLNYFEFCNRKASKRRSINSRTNHSIFRWFLKQVIADHKPRWENHLQRYNSSCRWSIICLPTSFRFVSFFEFCNRKASKRRSINSRTNHSIFRWFLPLHRLFLDLLCFSWYISFRFVILHCEKMDFKGRLQRVGSFEVLIQVKTPDEGFVIYL
jgi:hypothetical protein